MPRSSIDCRVGCLLRLGHDRNGMRQSSLEGTWQTDRTSQHHGIDHSPGVLGAEIVSCPGIWDNSQIQEAW